MATPAVLAWQRSGMGRRMRLDGNELNFAVFYVKYAPLVRRMLAHRGVRPSDLDDVLQDAFVTINRLLPEFEGRSSVETWLYSVTWRVAARHFRDARRNSEIPSDPAVSFIVDGPARDVSPNERLHATLGQLDERQRDVVALHEVGGFSISELSQLTGNTRTTIRNRLERGRKALGQRLWSSLTNVEGSAWLDQLAPRSAARLAQLQRPNAQHVICDGNAISVLDDIAIAVWRGPNTVAALEALIGVMLALIDKYPEGIRHLGITDATSTPPEREARQLTAWGLGKMGHKLRAAAWAIEDLRMKSVKTGLLNACLFVGGVPINTRIFDRVEPAARWLNGYGSQEWQQIAARVEDMRTQLDLAR